MKYKYKIKANSRTTCRTCRTIYGYNISLMHGTIKVISVATKDLKRNSNYKQENTTTVPSFSDL